MCYVRYPQICNNCCILRTIDPLPQGEIVSTIFLKVHYLRKEIIIVFTHKKHFGQSGVKLPLKIQYICTKDKLKIKFIFVVKCIDDTSGKMSNCGCTIFNGKIKQRGRKHNAIAVLLRGRIWHNVRYRQIYNKG